MHPWWQVTSGLHKDSIRGIGISLNGIERKKVDGWGMCGCWVLVFQKGSFGGRFCSFVRNCKVCIFARRLLDLSEWGYPNAGRMERRSRWQGGYNFLIMFSYFFFPLYILIYILLVGGLFVWFNSLNVLMRIRVFSQWFYSEKKKLCYYICPKKLLQIQLLLLLIALQ